MSRLAPALQSFFTDRLTQERRASAHTVAAYRDTFRLLFAFVQERAGKMPSQLDFADIDAPLVGTFLEQLETKRGNSIRTRNARLAAIHSFLRYAALRPGSVSKRVGACQRVLRTAGGPARVGGGEDDLARWSSEAPLGRAERWPALREGMLKLRMPQWPGGASGWEATLPEPG